MDPMELLAEGIILQATRDFRTNYRKLSRNPGDKYADAEMKRLMRFFHSQWFKILSNVDPDVLIDDLIVDEEERRMKKEKRCSRAFRPA